MDELEIERGYADFHRGQNRVLRKRDVKAFKVHVAAQSGKGTREVFLVYYISSAGVKPFLFGPFFSRCFRNKKQLNKSPRLKSKCQLE